MHFCYLCQEHVRTLICLEMHTHKIRCIRVHISVRIFHVARVLVLVVFLEIFFESQVRTLVEECVCTLLMAYANLGSTRFLAFSISFIINVLFYYLS